MGGLFIFLTLVFILVSGVMVLLILVQRPQGGGLSGAFGGASGAGAETVFGGRVGDALTWMTVGAFAVYLILALWLNMADPSRVGANPTLPPAVTAPAGAPAGGTPGLPDGSVTPAPVSNSGAPADTFGAPADTSGQVPAQDPNQAAPVIPPITP